MRIKAATILSKGHLKVHKRIPSKIFVLKIQVLIDHFFSLNIPSIQVKTEDFFLQMSIKIAITDSKQAQMELFEQLQPTLLAF